MPTTAWFVKAGWGAPTSCRPSDGMVTLAIGKLRIPVHKDAAPIFEGFIRDLLRRGIDLGRRPDDWGCAVRSIRGRKGTWSFHARGLAIDLDAIDYPLGSARDWPKWVYDLAKSWGLTPGGLWTKRPDPMHFELRLTKAQAQKLIASRKGRIGPASGRLPCPN